MATPVPPPSAPLQDRIEPIMVILLAAIVFFTLLMVAISKWSPNDGQTFQVLTGLVTGFSGAFLARIKPVESKPNGTDTKEHS